MATQYLFLQTIAFTMSITEQATSFLSASLNNIFTVNVIKRFPFILESVPDSILSIFLAIGAAVFIAIFSQAKLNPQPRLLNLGLIEPTIRDSLPFLILIGVMVVLIYGSFIPYLGIAKYDAYIFIEYISNNGSFIRMEDRPLAMMPWFFAYHLPDIGLAKFHICRVLYQLIASLCFFLILLEIFGPKRILFIFFASVIFSFYPSDRTSADLMSLVLRFVMALVCVVGYINLKLCHAKQSHTRILLGSISVILTFVAFFSYEATILPIVSIAIYATYQRVSRNLNIAIVWITILFPLALLVIYRLFFLQVNTEINLTPSYVLAQFSGGLIASFISGWLITAISKLNGVLGMASIAIFLFSSLYFVGLINRNIILSANDTFSLKQAKNTIVIGIFLTSVFYSVFYALPNYPLTPLSALNRLSYFPSLGASIVVPALILYLSDKLGVLTFKRTSAYLAALTFFSLLAIGSKLYWQDRDKIEWEIESNFWGQLVHEVPSVKDKTIFVFDRLPEGLVLSHVTHNHYASIWVNALYHNNSILGFVLSENSLPTLNAELIKGRVSHFLGDSYANSNFSIENAVKDINSGNKDQQLLSVDKSNLLFVKYDVQTMKLKIDCAISNCGNILSDPRSNFSRQLFHTSHQ